MSRGFRFDLPAKSIKGRLFNRAERPISVG
ncbi:hypothetical protein FHS26_005724 [Rhizobium pisi]|uniref:Uncharacterized protein n=1 Tax=Rhizobium pisi TaxID=574561 RepID=A0A7W5BS45_9HYPH|nr:hypothetical protein [Rhizobium pisi]